MLALLALFAPVGVGQSSEAAVKVAFVFNFTKFTEWPVAALPKGASPLSVCLLGNDTLGSAWNALDGKSAQGHPIEVRRVEGIEDARGCHLTYIARDTRALGDVLRALHAMASLTVSDAESFVRAGGIIELAALGNKMQFDVNLDAAQRAGVKISSQVLKLARSVVGEKK